MFYSLTGKIIYTDASTVAVECGGVAFRCTTSINTLQKTGGVGNIVTLYTYLHIREDAMELFGFYDNEELESFKQLISVSGVGPKAAIAILSVLTPGALAVCVTSGDLKTITKAQGVGAKIAQRIVLELKDKLSKTVPSQIAVSEFSSMSLGLSNANKSEAISALAALGYTHSDASSVIAKLDDSLSVQELIKQGLKLLSRGI